MMLENRTGLPNDWKINGEPIAQVSPTFSRIEMVQVPGEFNQLTVQLHAEWLMVEGQARFCMNYKGHDKPVKRVVFEDGTEWKVPQ